MGTATHATRPAALLALLVSAAGGAAGCGFDDGIEPGAIIECTDDRECPQGVCDPIAQRCVGAGDVAPTVLSSSLVPEDAGDGAVVTLELRANVPLAAAPALAFFGRASPFDLGVLVEEAKTARYTLTVDESVDEAFFELVSARLVAAGSGLERTAPLDLVLHVDRTPPAVVVVVVDAGGAGPGALPFSDADTSALAFTFAASEAVTIDDIAITGVDVAELDCDPTDTQDGTPAVDDAGRIRGARCTLVLVGADDAAVSVADVVVDASDAAGNRGSGAAAIAVDFRAPVVDDAQVSIETPAGAPESTATVGSVVSVSVVLSEPLGATGQAPVLALPGAVTVADVPGDPAGAGVVGADGAIAMRLRAGSVLAWDARFSVATVDVDDGTVVVPTIAMVDAVGHATATTLPPTTGGIRFTQSRQGVCPPLDASGCVDMDGDGQPAQNATCPSGTDCDDGDPLVYDGAIELPGDGVGNDCDGDGVDMAIDPAFGVFVDQVVGVSPPGCGTPTWPCLTLEEANDIAAADGRRWIFLLAGQVFNPSNGAPHRLLGGLARDVDDDTRWVRTAGRSSLDVGNVLGDVQDGIHMVAPTAVGSDAGGDSLFVRSAAGNISVRGRALLFESAISGDITITGGGARILSSSTSAGVIIADQQQNVVMLRSSVGRAIDVGPGASVDLVSSLLRGVVRCTRCVRVGLWHVTSFVDGVGDANVSATGTSPAAQRIEVRNSILHIAGLDPTTPASHFNFFGGATPAFSAVGNQHSCGRQSCNAYIDDGILFTALSAFEAEDSSDRFGSVNAGEAGVLAATGALISPSEPHSGQPLPAAAPPSVAVDLFGACRADAGYSGADATWP